MSMKKIILIIILCSVLGYVGNKVYIRNGKNQRAQVSSSKSVISGSLLTTSVQTGGLLKFSLTTSDILSNADIANIYVELLGTNIPLYPSKITTTGNATIFDARIPDNIPIKNNYDVILSTLPGKGELNWFFNESLSVIASSTSLVLPVLTDTENESEITAFSISATQPDAKNPGLTRITWSGAGRGVIVTKIGGAGAPFVKQLVYQNTFPIEDSGQKAVSPFFSISGEGLAVSGYSDAQLINTSTKPQTIQITFAPKGKNGLVAPAYAKTVDVLVPQTPFAMKIATNGPYKAGDNVSAQIQSFMPIMHLFASLRTSPETELYIQKNNTVYRSIDMFELKSDNTFSFNIPTELDVYKNKSGKLQKTGTEILKPGTYKVVLKTVFGIASQTVQVTQ